MRHKDGTILNAMDSVIHITTGSFPNTVTWVKILLIFGHGLFLMITVTLLWVDRGRPDISPFGDCAIYSENSVNYVFFPLN